jgi:formiminotetrahydrofolate cyclodeaminase
MATQQALIELPTAVLLDKFGAGGHKPGSGSAAALMGLLSAKLVVTVASLSLQRLAYRKDHAKIQFVMDSVEQQLEPRLKELFEHDAVVFDQVIKSRMARDNDIDEKEKRRLAHMALEKLKEATDIPFDICGICFRLIDHGIAMFDMGFKAARGDTGAAISAAVAGAMASIFVINLNLRSFRGSEWAKERRKRCDELHEVLESKQLAAFKRVMTLREEDVASISLPLSEQP